LTPVFIVGLQATSLKAMAANPLIRIRFAAKKTFGETFGAATGVSAPSYRRRRSLALRPLTLGLPSAGDHDSTY
jgi:hypothetical protein